MLTQRQKHSLRAFAAIMSCCVLLSAFLIYTNISNAEQPERVIFSEILEGAVAYSDDSGEPAVTLASDKLMETMFSEKYATFTLPDSDPYAITLTQSQTLDPGDPQGQDVTIIPEYTDDFPGIPDNPNEITLLSDELESLRSEISDDTTVKTTTDTSASLSDITSRSDSSTAPSDTSAAKSTESSVTTSRSTQATTSRTIATSRTTAPTTTRAATTAATNAKTTATAANTTSRAPITNVGGATFSNDDTIYLTMLKLVNDARRAAGVKELWYSARVHDVCRIRAVELSSYYSHNRPDGTKFSTAFKEVGINYDKCGENIAYGRNMFSTPEEVFKAWMESESHRENILSPDYECMAFGLSTLKIGNDTYYYWTQEFAKF